MEQRERPKRQSNSLSVEERYRRRGRNHSQGGGGPIQIWNHRTEKFGIGLNRIRLSYASLCYVFLDSYCFSSLFRLNSSIQAFS